uniref:CUB domain-containing protein n=1 Tax=Macrostomum lignano TaxID=282301 RepID=A0A1I8IYN7_9PLAT
MRGQGFDSRPDRELCQAGGDAQLVSETLRSRGPQLFLAFDAGRLPDWRTTSKFRLEYRFVTDFAIPGRPVREDTCEFEYSSASLPGGAGPGVTNSPMFNLSSGGGASHYPHNITCRYRFLAGPDEHARVRFTHFYVEDYFIEELANDKRHHTVGSFVPCAGDRVELREAGSVLMTYCGTAVPGPYASQFDSRELQLVFVSTWDKLPHRVYGRRTAPGFRLEFDFPKRRPPWQPQLAAASGGGNGGSGGDCGGDVASESHGGLVQLESATAAAAAATVSRSGRICEWRVRPTRPDGRVFVHFPKFQLEGSAKSCSMAIVRMYRGDSRVPQSELCGSDNAVPAFYGRPGEPVRVRLVAAPGSLGGRGLTFSWTEALGERGEPCPGFRCRHTGHCIDHRLECNRQPNCGSLLVNVTSVFNAEFQRWKNYSEYFNDNSDEEINSEKCSRLYATKATGPSETAYQLLHVGIGVLVTVAFLVGVVVFVLYREHRRASATATTSKKRRNNGAADRGDGLSADGGNDIPSPGATRQPLVPDHRDGFATVRNGRLGGGYAHSHSTSTLTREKMQKISIFPSDKAEMKLFSAILKLLWVTAKSCSPADKLKFHPVTGVDCVSWKFTRTVQGLCDTLSCAIQCGNANSCQAFRLLTDGACQCKLFLFDASPPGVPLGRLCPPGYQHARYGTSYKLVATTRLNWAEANRTCSSEPGRLAKFADAIDQDEALYLRQLKERLDSQSDYFLGGKLNSGQSATSKDAWRWTACNLAIAHDAWRSGQPDGSTECANLCSSYSDGGIDNHYCSFTQRYICECQSVRSRLSC